jgi:hypothetical protein
MSNQQTNASASNDYFDLHTRGIGYLNRTRWVDIKGKGGRRSEPFMACSINALHGEASDPNTSLFDCRVSGADAQEIIQVLMPLVAAKDKDGRNSNKVIVGFVIGDTYAHLYERKVRDNGRETGESEMACLIKGRLLQITYVKVNDEVVYHKDKEGNVTTSLDLGVSDDEPRRTGTHD